MVAVAMAADALPGQPRARLRETGATVPLSFIVAPRVGNQWSGSLDLAGAAPGEQTVDFLVRMRDGSDRVVASIRPSGEKLAAMTFAACFVNWTRGSHKAVSQSVTAPSSAPLARSLPSGE